jgi:hypothetical protein
LGDTPENSLEVTSWKWLHVVGLPVLLGFCYPQQPLRVKGKMELLTDELRRQLPSIRKLHNPADEDRCMIYARFFTLRTGVAFYVAEGEARQSDYLFWGLVTAPQFKFPSRFQITLGQLQTNDWLGQEPCQRDEHFQPALWGAIERTIPNLRRPL